MEKERQNTEDNFDSLEFQPSDGAGPSPSTSANTPNSANAKGINNVNISRSQSSHNRAPGTPGPRASTPVWKYFVRKTIDCKLYSCCIYCDYKNLGKVVTNCRNHMRKHKEEYEEMIEIEKKRFCHCFKSKD